MGQGGEQSGLGKGNKLAKKLTSKSFSYILVAIITISLLPPATSHAIISGCSFSLDSHSFNAGGSNSLNLSIHNLSSISAINWIQISKPSVNYWLYGVNPPAGWNVTGDSTSLFIFGDQIASLDSQNFGVTFATDVFNAPNQSWQINVSDSGDSSAAIACSGNGSSNITGHPDNSSDNSISDISVSGVDQSSATIAWQSDSPSSSYIYYGTSSSYGSTSSYDDNRVSGHSQQLTGLAAGTTYYFQVAGSDDFGNSSWSADRSFTTLSSIIKSPAIQNTPTQTKTLIISDGQPPIISLTSLKSSIFKSTPSISGQATDNTAIAKLEYSLDGGKNWLIIDHASGLQTKNSVFSFTPNLIDDGNYTLLARATDKSGLKSLSNAVVFVIDRLPPIVGGSSISIGQLPLVPSATGTYQTIVGLSHTIVLDSTGGATAITIDATDKSNIKNSLNFSLLQMKNTNLWQGSLKFSTPGEYLLQADGLDGAGNITHRMIGSIAVRQSGKISDTKTNQNLSSKVSVFYLDNDTNQWLLWDGRANLQQNPIASKDGQFSLYLPAGKYYLNFSSTGHQSIKSNIFKLDDAEAIRGDIKLNSNNKISIGPIKLAWSWPSLKTAKLEVLTANNQQIHIAKSASLKTVSNFNLPLASGGTFSSLDLLGKPTIISFVSSWSNDTTSQLAILDSIKNPELNVIAVSSGQSLARTKIYADLAGLQIPMLADEDNLFMLSQQISYTPAHLFLDRHGRVAKTAVGLMSKQELIANVVN